jgi:hypothetical protein
MCIGAALTHIAKGFGPASNRPVPAAWPAACDARPLGRLLLKGKKISFCSGAQPP